MSHLPIRLRLTVTYVALLVAVTALVLAASWVLLRRQLERTIPAEYADAALAQLGSQYGLALAGAALLALGIGWLAAGSALAPLGRIAATARRVSEDRLDERVRMQDGPDDELRELATAFDAMLDRVAGAVAAQQRFVANASHELRTPLTVIRTSAEVALDDPHATVEDLREVAREAVRTTERTEELLDGLLVLAALNGSRPPARRDEPVDLRALARRVVRAAGDEAAAAGVELHASLHAAPVRGDAALLERLIANLVENAIRHGEGGPARPVIIAARTGAGHARLRVVNGGDPIAPADLARLTQPFERVRRNRARGTGLGLSIVLAVAQAHGGELHLSAPATGGLVAEVVFPQAGAGYGEVTHAPVASAP